MTAGGTADRSLNNAQIYVKLKDLDKRNISQSQLMQRTRALLKKYPADIHTSVDLVSTVGGKPEQRRRPILHPGAGPRQAGAILGKDAGADEDHSEPGGHRHHAAQRQAGSAAGDRPAARRRPGRFGDGYRKALNTLVAGQVASSFKAGEDEYDVRVRAAEEFRVSAAELARMTVPSNKGRGVGLDEVVRIVPGTGPSSINRINRQRQVTLTGNV
jgi:hydrophobic/amphiphilic exporter-1 (mainly G- bacteria), HAE1 family